ncbi:hydroxypyruvate isomerase [Pandoraea pnomenusa]|uniref:hydroxypyruvate isomerase n=1 Tax=Pandoraea TaxID=93217 RepID=UPI0003C76E08|nr:MULTISPECIES: hydroxypyruvate isomerase [Pandoraea]AHB06252.1 hydroxypyruvate isomerase [Pandoraea pnomenusa 3kgm]AHB77698.1 hydroxypyruvate isomerase [Pandoraea pnomenusa]
MPKFAANLTMLFNEVPFLDRFKAAAAAGFRGVEFLFPYAFHRDQIADKLNQYQLDLVLHNLPAGNWDAGERGIAIFPDRVAEFRDGVGEAITYAKALGVKQLNCLVGKQGADLSTQTAQETLVGNLRFAADALKAEGIRLLVEPINTFDIPGFFVNRTKQALEIFDAVGSDNLFLQYDIYHMQRMEGELAKTIETNLARIAHVQLADNPGRNEPGTGEINYAYLFAFLDRIGYNGWIGCEYKPATTTAEGLGWFKAAGLREAA